MIKDNTSPPSLDALVPAIKAGLAENFKDVDVAIEPCPDLRQSPFNLAGEGLCGAERVADIGGQPYLSPIPNLSKKYSMLDVAELMEMSKDKGFLLGAGAGPFHELGHNSELVPGLAWNGPSDMTNSTHVVKINEAGGCSCEKLSSTGFGLMCNLFGSEGAPGPVLKVTAKCREGKLNFPQAIQAGLKQQYGDQRISIGGVFLLKTGKAKFHIMPPKFPTRPMTTEEKLKWLQYFDMRAPMVCQTVFHSHDPGLGLRMEHTHCFSEHGEGGHYHYDVTPDEVEYEGYFQVAKVLYRIDRPPQ